MAVFQWVILCERVIIEESAKTVSLISMIENINLPSPPPELFKDGKRPLVPFRFYVVHQWARSKPKIGERIPGRVLLVSPSGEEFGTSEFVVDLIATPQARVIGQTIGFPLYGQGVYSCVVQAKVRTKWRKVGGTQFSVAFTDGSTVGSKRSVRH